MAQLFYTGRLPVKALAASLESNTTGKSITELEYVFFGQLSDLDALKALAADVEEQVQFSIIKPNGTVRVRSVNDQEFELTTKVWTAGVVGKKEATNPTSKDQFDDFSKIADSGMRKTRFIVPIDGTEGTWVPNEDNPTPKYEGRLFWEFDVFFDNAGNLIPWVKIDLEVPEQLPQVPAFPVELTNVIMNQFGQRTPEEEAFVKQLYSDSYTFKIEAA